jgi:hypothetical protein
MRNALLGERGEKAKAGSCTKTQIVCSSLKFPTTMANAAAESGPWFKKGQVRFYPGGSLSLCFSEAGSLLSPW